MAEQLKISIIIPALNEAKCITRTLEHLQAQQGPMEIIVVDGGSEDDTTTIAGQYATVIPSQKGRALQMNLGASHASGQVLLFLHADTLLPSDGLEIIRNKILLHSFDAGTFRLRFDTRSPLLNFYSFCTRFNIPSICFGDRSLFVKKNVFETREGFPLVRMFEDLLIVKDLVRTVNFCFLGQSVQTSARRFNNKGHFRQQLLNLYLWSRYIMGTPPDKLAHLYSYEEKTKC